MAQDIQQLHAHYRQGDTQFRLAGGQAGCMKLANDFYDIMETLPAARHIRRLHKPDLGESHEKLGLFLCGYLNGPELYAEKYGRLQLAPAHGHVPIRSEDRDAWLLCMQKALDRQPWPQEFKAFLLQRLSVPAERCRNRP